jgi:ribosomal-protein-alanine N-acetyltransferase
MSSLTLRYMRTGDIGQVIAIDNVSFDPPWSARSYAYEISESSYSHMVVLERSGAGAAPARWRRLFGLAANGSESGMIVGYGGLWQIADEAHISTIATHPGWRGRGYGEILLAGMVRRACTLGAAYVVLEVRVSNHVAQSLYYKYDFVIAGVKQRYYRNNNEDAYDMRLDLADADLRARFEERLAALRQRQPFTDSYSEVAPVRR